ncbi:hypothetical protein OUZ56_024953 [Daphnia magna]|uniref:Uncharacterized protein n=1 Tax=Daphnia magna TaxID=35525 RepID=A0ABQ9ZIG6_9CRUS|nr:hypothetical protein OUZ56_024953 [Daphnia magna]
MTRLFDNSYVVHIHLSQTSFHYEVKLNFKNLSIYAWDSDNRWTAYWFFFGSGGGVWKLSLGPVRANRERRNLVQSNQRSQGYLFQINQNSRLGLKCSYVKHQYVLNKNFVIDRIAEELKHLFIVFFSYVPKDLNTTTKGRTAQMELQNRNTWIRQSFLAANHDFYFCLILCLGGKGKSESTYAELESISCGVRISYIGLLVVCVGGFNSLGQTAIRMGVLAS